MTSKVTPLPPDLEKDLPSTARQMTESPVNLPKKASLSSMLDVLEYEDKIRDEMNQAETQEFAR